MIMYGVKMLSLDSLTNNNYVGRPASLCDYVKKRGQKEPNFIKDIDCSVVFETCLGSDNPIYTLDKAYTLVFVPQDYMETKMIHDTMLESLESIQPNLISIRSTNSVDNSITYYENKLSNSADRYFPKSKIYEASCLMIIMDENRVVEVYSAHPRRFIENMFFKDVEYECADCGKLKVVKNTEFEGYCPKEWYYKGINKDDTEYFCPDCAEVRTEPLAHLGDYNV